MPSKKVLEEKKKIVADLNEKIKRATAGVIVDYRGLNVLQDTALRSELRKSGVEYAVIKNTLLNLALSETGLEGVKSCLENPTALALSYDDVVAPAKIISEFAKKNEKLEIKAGFVEGSVMNADEVVELGKIPPKETLIAKVLGGINSPIASFVVVLGQIAAQKANEEA